MKKVMLLNFVLFLLAVMSPVPSVHAGEVGNAIGYTTGNVTAYFITAPRYPHGRYYYIDKNRAVDASLEAECERMGGRRGTSTDRCVEKLRNVIQEKQEPKTASDVPVPYNSTTGRTLKHSKSDMKEVMAYIRGRRAIGR